MRHNNALQSFAFHVRRGGDSIDFIAEILNSLKLRALDSATGEIFSASAAKESFGQWQAFAKGACDGAP